jgi:hypothetical protein
MISEVCAANGIDGRQSGTSIMSDSLIAFHPAIDDPSNITPSLRKSSVIGARRQIRRLPVHRPARQVAAPGA